LTAHQPTALQPKSVEVVLTSACDLECGYCYQDRRDNRVMDWTVLDGVITGLLESNHPSPSLTFLGGEPLLALDLLERTAERLDGRIELLVSTNGTLLEERAISLLARHNVDTQISWDGVAQERRAPGTSELIERNIAELRHCEPEFFQNRCSVTVTVGSHNLDTLAENFDFLIDRGVAEVAVAPLITHDPGWRTGHIELLAGEMALILRQSLEILQDTGEVPFSAFRTPEDEGPGQTMPKDGMCHFGCTDRLAVDVDGRVFGCVLVAESYQRLPSGPLGEALLPLRLGPIGGPEFEGRLTAFPDEVRSNGLFDRKREKYSSYGRCSECRFVEVCSVCPISTVHIPDNTDPHRVSDLQCAFNLVLHTCRERFVGALKTKQ
jgi:sulfatase maturation enzyme AslB (radical SAM superfamily)